MAVFSNGVAGASGSYLEIPEGAGNPPKLEAGKAVFSVEVPEDGLVTLWCRVWWEGECSNSFTIGFDDQPTFLFGEDATYKAWHWVKYPVSRTVAPIKLAKGKHTLVFHNREDGVRLDQVLLSADKRFVPVDIEPAGTRPGPDRAFMPHSRAFFESAFWRPFVSPPPSGRWNFGPSFICRPQT